MKEIKRHGTSCGYVLGCRCELCRGRRRSDRRRYSGRVDREEEALAKCENELSKRVLRNELMRESARTSIPLSPLGVRHYRKIADEIKTENIRKAVERCASLKAQLERMA